MVDFSKLMSLKDRKAQENARLAQIPPYRVSSEKEAKDLFLQIKRDMKNNFNTVMDRGNATFLQMEGNPEDLQIKAGHYIFNMADRPIDVRVVAERAMQILNRGDAPK